MNARDAGRRGTAVATTLIAVGSVIALGVAVSTVAGTIPALAGTTNSGTGSTTYGGGVQSGNGGGIHVRSNGS